jgi:hypothetical protein
MSAVIICEPRRLRALWKTAHEHFADKVARSEADDETDDHACKYGYNRLVYRSYSVHLEVIRRKQREDEQHTDDEQRPRRVQLFHFRRLACVQLHGQRGGRRAGQGKVQVSVFASAFSLGGYFLCQTRILFSGTAQHLWRTITIRSHWFLRRACPIFRCMARSDHIDDFGLAWAGAWHTCFD